MGLLFVAGKEERKRVLKKNKMLRQANEEKKLKTRDPKALYQEIAALSHREKNCQSSYEQLPLQDKQEKLRASLQEALAFAAKSNPEKMQEFQTWQSQFDADQSSIDVLYYPADGRPNPANYPGGIVPPPPPPRSQPRELVDDEIPMPDDDPPLPSDDSDESHGEEEDSHSQMPVSSAPQLTAAPPVQPPPGLVPPPHLSYPPAPFAPHAASLLPPPSFLPPGFVPPHGILPPRTLMPPQRFPVAAAAPAPPVPRPAAPVLDSATAKASTISAAPQVVDRKQQMMRMVPTAVRVRREAPPTARPAPAKPTTLAAAAAAAAKPAAQPPMRNKDEAYARFMSEMGDLL